MDKTERFKDFELNDSRVRAMLDYRLKEQLSHLTEKHNKEIADLESKLELLTKCKRGSESGNIDCSKYNYSEKDYCIECKNKKLINSKEGVRE